MSWITGTGRVLRLQNRRRCRAGKLPGHGRRTGHRKRKATRVSQYASAMTPRRIVDLLLDQCLCEATVCRPPRGTRWIASFTGAVPGHQVWRSTGLRDRDAALALAKSGKLRRVSNGLHRVAFPGNQQYEYDMVVVKPPLAC
ncbi:MAG: DUF5956 family protein [Limisphaerales bacterium]